ncbi:MAG: hypothetical protein DDT29_01416 [Dehalococcoidia bacterium]|nr:hypothetical protein [Bacillota bacterium]
MDNAFCDSPEVMFSEEAHLAAQKQLYPNIFKRPFGDLKFIATTLGISKKTDILDGEMGIDRMIEVTVNGFRKPLLFTVQERFRSPEYAKYKDITITEWNNVSGLPSELYKINAGIFVYGYYDSQSAVFLDAIVVETARLLFLLAVQQVHYEKRRNKRQQDFITIPFSDLKRGGAVLWRFPGIEK